MKTVDLVQVIWNDACQVRSEKDAKALRMMSFGFLRKDDEDGVVLAQSQSEVGEFVDCLFIPRGMVLEVNRIPLPEGRGNIYRMENGSVLVFQGWHGESIISLS